VINGGRISREEDEVVVVMEVERGLWKQEMRGEFKLYQRYWLLLGKVYHAVDYTQVPNPPQPEKL